jgi:hypothetical protein
MIELLLMILGIVSVVGLAVGVRLLRWRWFWRDTMNIREINRDD